MIEEYLSDLERRVDPEIEQRLFAEWRDFAEGRLREGFFCPSRSKATPPGVSWPAVLINDAVDDFDKMALHQLKGCSDALAEANGALLAVRCNYGTGILPSLFGAEVFMMDREIDTLPGSRPLPGGADAVKAWLDKGPPDLNVELGAKVFEMGRRFVRLLDDYPKLARHVHIYHPDLQGPMNVCELLWGSSLYVDLYDVPDLVEDFLSLICATYVAFMQRWFEIVPLTNGLSVHWSMLHRGSIMIREDAATNLSPEMVERFVLPAERRLLDTFDGGAIHFCGRGDHFIGKITDLPGVFAVNVTQSELNDMAQIYRHTVDKGINLLGLDRATAQQAVSAGRDLLGRAHCW